MDHTDCGACKLFLKDQYPATRAAQVPCHKATLEGLENEIKQRYPELGVEKHIMHVNGKVLDV